jgi:signal transduction histidine kinase
MAGNLLNKHASKFDSDVIHRLERIQKNVEVEADLINELLELSRIKTTRQKMEMVDVDAMARELGGVFENDLKTRGINLIFDTRLPVIHGEKSRLRQVFQNLLDNAIKYMGDGPTKEIRIGAFVGQREAEFYVRDTGLGIDKEDVGQVFHIFRRGKNVAQGVSGKGVGLANVKSIIQTYNGRIWVESARGTGSTFRFTIGGMFVPAIASGTAKPQAVASVL